MSDTTDYLVFKLKTKTGAGKTIISHKSILSVVINQDHLSVIPVLFLFKALSFVIVC